MKCSTIAVVLSLTLALVALPAMAQAVRTPSATAQTPTAVPTVASPGAPPCPNRYVKVSTDRFSGAASMSTSVLDTYTPRDKLSVAVLGADNVSLWNGKWQLDNGSLWLRFIYVLTKSTHAHASSLIQCSGVYILADGQIMETLEGFHGIRAGKVVVVEGAITISVPLTAEEVARLGVAKNIEFRVCADERAASPAFIKAVHEFACKVAAHGTAATR